MAKITPSSLISEIRGSVGDETFSKNRYGAYVKSKLIQTNPDTAYQQAARANFALGVSEWQGLSDADANQWIFYSKQNVLRNSLGQPYKRSGYNEFIQRVGNRYLIDSVATGFNPLPRVRSRPLSISLEFASEQMEVSWLLSQDIGDVSLVVYATPPLSSSVRSINPSLYNAITYVTNPSQSDVLDIYSDYIARYSTSFSDNGKRIGIAIKIVNSDNFDGSGKLFTNTIAEGVFPSNFSAGYQAVIDRANVLALPLPSSANQIAQNDLYVALASAGIIAVLDSFYVLANSGAEDFSLIDWIDPSRALASKENSPVFTPGQGWAGAPTAGLITDFNPFVDSVVAGANSVHLMAYSLTDKVETTIIAGVTGTNSTSCYIAPLLVSPANMARSLANDSSVQDYGNMSSAGMLIVDRSDASTVGFSVDGGAFSDASKASAGLPDNPLGLCCRYFGAGPNAGSDRIISFVSFGGSIRGLQSTYLSILDAYLTTL